MATFAREPGGRRGRKEDDPDTRLSKKLARLLRHRLHENGLSDVLRPDGFVPVSRVLRALPGADVASLRRVVATNDKQRFSLLEDGGVLYVRANQGHSLQQGLSDDAMLRAVTLDDASGGDFCCVHGTYRHAWEAIKTQGLHKMSRRHVHFAPAVDSDAVISGMRRNSEILVYLDAPAALKAGLKLYRSENGVLLTPGIDGVVPPHLFNKVVDAKTGQDLLENTATAPS